MFCRAIIVRFLDVRGLYATGYSIMIAIGDRKCHLNQCYNVLFSRTLYTVSDAPFSPV
jgi:hypothetical protein